LVYAIISMILALKDTDMTFSDEFKECIFSDGFTKWNIVRLMREVYVDISINHMVDKDEMIRFTWILMVIVKLFVLTIDCFICESANKIIEILGKKKL